MKRFLILSAFLTCLAITGIAQALMTNTSQSTRFVRMPSRNASLEIDAVHYNPAGLTCLENGFHFGFCNQGILLNKSVASGYPLLNDGDFTGKIRSLFMPSAFGVYKTNKLAFSVGYGIIAGDGKVEFDKGLPTFEIPVSRVIPELKGLNSYGYDITAYKTGSTFKGKTGYHGVQAGISYEILKGLSVAGGVRFVSGRVNFEQINKDIQLEVNGTWENASEILTTIGSQLQTIASLYSTLSNNVQSIITGGAGSLTIAQAQTFGYITSSTRAQWEAALGNIGFSSAQIAAMNMNTVKSHYSATASGSSMQSILALFQSDALEDREFTKKNSGSGFLPWFGVNYSPFEYFNISLKYEHKVTIAISDESDSDKPILIHDIPGCLSAGIRHKPLNWLETQLSFNLYLDKNVDWGLNIREIVAHNRETVRTIDRNSFDLALGLQFNLNDHLAVSTGVLAFLPGANSTFQCDYSYINPLITAGLGVEWKIVKKLALDIGLMGSFSKSQDVTYQDTRLQTYFSKYPLEYSEPEFVNGEYSDNLKKSSLIFSVGLSYSLSL